MSDSVPYVTRLYRERKAAGHCPICGGKRDLADHICCSKCIAYRRKIYVYKAARMTGEEKAARNAKASEKQKARRQQLRAEGRCAACGAPSPDRYFCAACMAKRKRSKAKKEIDRNG